MPEINFTPTKDALVAQLDRIKKSNAIGRSKNYRKLLTFLVEQTIIAIEQDSLESHSPKEIDIAQKVFGKDEYYNCADDSSVRVYISILRKKLIAYYENEGVEEFFQISIPPGSYGLIFKENNVRKKSLLTKKTSLKYSAFAALLMISIGLNLWFYNNHNTQPKSPYQSNIIWQELYNNGKPTLVVLGDIFIFNEKAKLTNLAYAKERIIQDDDINNNSNLREFIAKHPEKQRLISEATTNFLLKGTAFAVHDISRLFTNNKNINMKVASELTANDIKNNNLIYIGQHQHLGLLSRYIENSNFSTIRKNNLTPRNKSLINKTTEDVYVAQGSYTKEYKDYGLFSKLNGPKDNVIYIFSGFTDSAIMLLAKKLTKPNSPLPSNIKTSVDKNNQPYATNFEMVAEVNSFNRTVISHKVIYSDNIKAKVPWPDYD